MRFEVWGPEFEVGGARIWLSKFKVQGLGVRVQGHDLGFKFEGCEIRV